MTRSTYASNLVVAAASGLVLVGCTGTPTIEFSKRPNNVYDQAVQRLDDPSSHTFAREALLKRYPVGSPVKDLVSFLEATGSKCVRKSRSRTECADISWYAVGYTLDMFPGIRVDRKFPAKVYIAYTATVVGRRGRLVDLDVRQSLQRTETTLK